MRSGTMTEERKGRKEGIRLGDERKGWKAARNKILRRRKGRGATHTFIYKN